MKQTLALLLVLALACCKGQSSKLSDEGIEVNQVSTSYDIYYSLGRADLQKDQCKPTLDSILTFLNAHPTITIEIGVHTDFRGDAEDNRKLSQSRADNLKEYFVSNGINTNRITPIGYGESKPIRSLAEQNELGNDMKNVNRRVTFKILKK